MTKSSGSMSFRSSRKVSGKKNSKNPDIHAESFPFKDTFRTFNDPYGTQNFSENNMNQDLADDQPVTGNSSAGSRTVGRSSVSRGRTASRSGDYRSRTVSSSSDSYDRAGSNSDSWGRTGSSSDSRGRTGSNSSGSGSRTGSNSSGSSGRTVNSGSASRSRKNSNNNSSFRNRGKRGKTKKTKNADYDVNKNQVDHTTTQMMTGKDKSIDSTVKKKQGNHATFRNKTDRVKASDSAANKNRANNSTFRTNKRNSDPGTPQKMPDKKRKAVGCLVPVIIILILFAVIYFLVYHSFSKVEKHKTDTSAITVNHKDKNMEKYETIALFGVDDQDNVIKDVGSRSDSITLACINKRTKKVKLMSIYRDTYVSIDGKYDKINAAYSYGGPEQAMNTINRNLDLDVTEFATINFKELADAIDILGGVELTIESEKELDNLNDYIGNMNKINGGDSPKFEEPGTYTFDGNQAVAYSRIRYMAGGDHARANHQRLVLEAILKEAKKQPWKVPSLVDKVLPQCKTNLSTDEFTRMALGLFLYDIEDSQAYPFDSFDERYNGIYYGFPTTVKSNVIKAHEYLFGTKDYQPTEELLKISKKVKNISDEIEP